MNFYMAEIAWYCEIDEEVRKEKCLTFGFSYADALERISKYYGEESIEKIDIEFLYESEVFPLSEESYTTIKSLNLY